MYKKVLATVLSLLLMTLVIVAIQAQDEPTFFPEDDVTSASVSLEAGFVLDPYLVRVLGGGSMPASDLRSTCAGFIRPEPNFVLNWSGETDNLLLFTYSDDDMALVIELPNGEFVCSDDANLLTLDALLLFEQPEEGEYRIWIGAFEEGVPTIGFLVITENPMELSDLDLSPLLLRDENPTDAPMLEVEVLEIEEVAIFGTEALEPGFASVSVDAAGGGDLAIAEVMTGNETCVGFVSIVPTYSFTWSGETDGVRVFFESEEDSALIILTPEGEFLCNDNSDGDANTNPAVDIANPIVGEYEVFVASDGPETIATGSLTVTEDLNQTPAARPKDSQ